MKQLYKANGKVYMFVEYSDGLYGDCTKCDLFKVDDKTCIEAPCGGGYFVENKEEKIMNNVNKHINKPHIHAEVIKAWADGAEIEYYTTFDNKWSIATTPAWKRDTQYRVKLEPSYPKTRLTGGGEAA